MMAARRKNGKKSFCSWKGLLAVVVLMLTLASSKDTLAFMKSETGEVKNVFDFYYYYALKYDINGGDVATQPGMQLVKSKNNSYDFKVQHQKDYVRDDELNVITSTPVTPSKENCFFLGWAEEQYGAVIENGVAKYNTTTSNGQSDTVTVSVDDNYRDNTLEGYGFSKTLYAQWGSQLIPGPELNIALKQISINQDLDKISINTSKSPVKKIVFAQVNKDTDLYAQENGMRGLGESKTGIVVDLENTGSIKLYYKQDEQTAYILSQHIIFANPNSRHTFHILRNLESIEFQNFNTDLATDMRYMFNQCQSISSLDIRRFVTSKVTNMDSMFAKCHKLKTIQWDTSKFDTGNVQNMDNMFFECKVLENFDLSQFDTHSVETMARMFGSCTAIEMLDLSSFDTSQVKDMSQMFDGASALVELNLSSFDTSKVTNMIRMFYSCGTLTTIYVGDDWNVDQVLNSDAMFYQCYDLVGGNGTEFDDFYEDKTFACVDTPDQEGYLTHISQKSLSASLFSEEKSTSNIVSLEASEEIGEMQESETLTDETMEDEVQDSTETEETDVLSDENNDEQKEVAP